MWEIIIAGAASIKVPALFDSAIRSVGERLLGPIMDSWGQSTKDRTEQRSRIAKALADLAVQEVQTSPEAFRSEVNLILARAGCRIDRVAEIFQKSIQHFPGEPSPDAKAEAPEADWLNKWTRFAEDISSDEMQDLFARILAGQIQRKGSFSLQTLRIASELTAELASDFQTLWSEAIVNLAIRYSEYERGPKWAMLQRLSQAGLIDPNLSSWFHTMTDEPWRLSANPTLEVRGIPAFEAQIPTIRFTRAGTELGSILPVPDLAANLRRLGSQCPSTDGWLGAYLVWGEEEQCTVEHLWGQPY